MFREVTTRRGEKASAWRKYSEKVEKLAEGVQVRLKDVRVQKGLEIGLKSLVMLLQRSLLLV